MRAFFVWIVALAVITLGGVALLNAAGGSYQDASPAVILIAYSPLLAALIAVVVTGGFRSFLRQFTRWRVHPGWYLLVLVGPLVLVGVAALVGGTLAPLALPSAAFLGPLIAGSLGEEPGWRGLAQPSLQSRLGLVAAALVVGLVWATWHLWPLLTPLGRTELDGVAIAESSVRLVATSVIYAWIYVATKESLPIVMLAHAGHNIADELLAPTELGALVMSTLYVVAAVVVILLLRRAVPARPRSAASVTTQ
jgi:membrane protease YdiL (CAAX protease family)